MTEDRQPPGLVGRTNATVTLIKSLKALPAGQNLVLSNMGRFPEEAQ